MSAEALSPEQIELLRQISDNDFGPESMDAEDDLNALALADLIEEDMSDDWRGTGDFRRLPAGRKLVATIDRERTEAATTERNRLAGELEALFDVDPCNAGTLGTQFDKFRRGIDAIIERLRTDERSGA